MNLHRSKHHALLRILAAAALCASRSPDAGACGGYYGPPAYLGRGGRLTEATPEFFWRLELQRLTRNIHPREKRLIAPDPGGDEEPQEHIDRFTTAMDLRDFDDALKTGRLHVTDAVDATKRHTAARAALLKGAAPPEPPEIPSEFADYHRGADAFRREDYAAAREAWESLLARPARERHYRSVWAALMLAKLGEKEDHGTGPLWFQKTRELAAAGFADSLGLAAESYGWEAEGEEKRGHRARAAELYLTQLALGDESSIDALHYLLPRGANDDWAGAAADPLLRKLRTIHLLAMGHFDTRTGIEHEDFENAHDWPALGRRWLAEIEKLHLQETDAAEYLGWVAYEIGDYALAQRWLDLAKTNSPAAHWLRARLLRREGKLTAAAREMVQAWKATQDLSSYTGTEQLPIDPDDTEKPGRDRVNFSAYNPCNIMSFLQSAGGDYGALQLARGDFVAALDAFYKSTLWADAAYVAEKVLTVDELKHYVDRQPPEPPPILEGNLATLLRHRSLRGLLGRRLMREKRYTEARLYLPAPYPQVARAYVQAMHDGGDSKLPAATRARAWFHAGWMARYAGMEIIGTEGEPDDYASSGQFPSETLRAERMTGIFQESQYDDTKHQGILRASPVELARLRKTKTQPDVRFHYRFSGVDQMLTAASMLPDNSPELVGVLNRAGSIVMNSDSKLADRIYQQLERRCTKTEVGQAVIARHWFVPDQSAWSKEEDAALEKMLGATP